MLLSRMRVLLMSGVNNTQQIKKLLDAGAGGCIQKPFSMEELSRQIKEILPKELMQKDR